MFCAVLTHDPVDGKGVKPYERNANGILSTAEVTAHHIGRTLDGRPDLPSINSGPPQSRSGRF